MSEVAEAAVVEALQQGRSVVLRALGGSMGNGLSSGARVRIDAGARPRVGRVVAVRRPDGGLALHRLVGRTANGAITWGDAMPRPDAWKSRVILGEVSVVEAPPSSFRGRVGAPGRALWHVAVGLAMSAWHRCSSRSGR